MRKVYELGLGLALMAGCGGEVVESAEDDVASELSASRTAITKCTTTNYGRGFYALNGPTSTPSGIGVNSIIPSDSAVNYARDNNLELVCLNFAIPPSSPPLSNGAAFDLEGAIQRKNIAQPVEQKIDFDSAHTYRNGARGIYTNIRLGDASLRKQYAILRDVNQLMPGTQTLPANPFGMTGCIGNGKNTLEVHVTAASGFSDQSVYGGGRIVSREGQLQLEHYPSSGTLRLVTYTQSGALNYHDHRVKLAPNVSHTIVVTHDSGGSCTTPSTSFCIDGVCDTMAGSIRNSRTPVLIGGLSDGEKPGTNFFAGAIESVLFRP